MAAPDKPVYLLTGSDRPKIETALARLRKHFVAESIDVSSAPDTSGDQASLCNAASLFGSTRLVVVEDVDGARDSDGRRMGWKAADVEAVSAYLSNPAPDSVLALVGGCQEDDRALEALREGGPDPGVRGCQEGRPRLGRGAVPVARVSAEPEASALLVQLVGDDSRSLASEMDKVATWAAGEPVGEREIEMLVATTADAPTYELTDAWAGRDAARALAASETIFERESRARRDTAARLAGALGGHLGRLRALKGLATQGVRPKQAAERLKLHPFYAEKVLSQAEGFSPRSWTTRSFVWRSLDGSLKGQSRARSGFEVQRAVVELTRRPGAARAS